MALRDVTNRVFGGNKGSGNSKNADKNGSLVDDGRGILRSFSHSMNPTSTSMAITFEEVRLKDCKELSPLMGQALQLTVSMAGTTESKACYSTHCLKAKDKLSFFFKDPSKSSAVFSIRRKREEIFTELTITAPDSRISLMSSVPYMAKDENNFFFYPLHANCQNGKGNFLCGEIKLKVEYRTEDFFEDSASEVQTSPIEEALYPHFVARNPSNLISLPLPSHLSPL